MLLFKLQQFVQEAVNDRFMGPWLSGKQPVDVHVKKTAKQGPSVFGITFS
jgi:hypothetical protein